jgi:putative ABC transport system permease protein
VAETDQTPTIVTPPGKCAPGGGGTGCPGAPRPALAVRVAGRPGLVLEIHAYDGDAAWLGWPIASGRWFRGPRQADVDSSFLAATGRKVGDRITLTVNGEPVTLRIAGEVFAPGSGPAVFTGWPALGGAGAGLAVSHYDVAIQPGTTTGGYIRALTRALGPGYDAYTPAGGSVAAQVNTSYFRLLAVAVAVLAGLGVLNSVLMATRERVHDLGVFKAVGMTPRQSIAMVISWVIPPAVIAAVIALPAGLILQATLVQNLAASAFQSRTGSGPALPGSYVHVLGAADLLLLALAGLGIAAAGALGPATWAATARTTTALRAE